MPFYIYVFLQVTSPLIINTGSQQEAFKQRTANPSANTSGVIFKKERIMLKVTPCLFPKANTCTRQSREFNTVRDLMSHQEAEIGPSKRRTVLTEEGQKYAKLSMGDANLDEAAKGRSVESTKGEHLRQKFIRSQLPSEKRKFQEARQCSQGDEYSIPAPHEQRNPQRHKILYPKSLGISCCCSKANFCFLRL